MTHTLNSIPLLENKKSAKSVIILFPRQVLLSPLVAEKAQIFGRENGFQVCGLLSAVEFELVASVLETSSSLTLS